MVSSISFSMLDEEINIFPTPPPRLAKLGNSFMAISAEPCMRIKSQNVIGPTFLHLINLSLANFSSLVSILFADPKRIMYDDKISIHRLKKINADKLFSNYRRP